MLDLIHASAPHIPFKPAVVEQLHRDLYQFTQVPAGRWKTVDNAIREQRAGGSQRMRFETVSAADTPVAMEELHERFRMASASGQHHALLLIGAYVFDFLAIRQFIRSSIADEFTVADVRRAAAGISTSHLSKTLAKLRDDGIIEPVGAGRAARWRRLRDDF